MQLAMYSNEHLQLTCCSFCPHLFVTVCTPWDLATPSEPPSPCLPPTCWRQDQGAKYLALFSCQQLPCIFIWRYVCTTWGLCVTLADLNQQPRGVHSGRAKPQACLEVSLLSFCFSPDAGGPEAVLPLDGIAVEDHLCC